MTSTSIAWKNGQWLPLSEVHLALDDWGVLQGATIVDRLRTIDSQPLDVPLHLQRLKENCKTIGVDSPELDQLDVVILECARHNQSRLADRDFAIVVLVTPGRTSTPNSPTIIVHVQPLNWAAIQYWYQHGQSLVVATNRNVPEECWSPKLKTRSRLQYYLADQQAFQSSGHYAGAILLNTNGYITETSAANILVVDQTGNLCSPPEESILGGISLIRTLKLAEMSGLSITRVPISLEMIESAREVILTGTSACIWPASQVGKVRFTNPTQLPVYRALLAGWIESVGSDFQKRPG